MLIRTDSLTFFHGPIFFQAYYALVMLNTVFCRSNPFKASFNEVIYEDHNLEIFLRIYSSGLHTTLYTLHIHSILANQLKITTQAWQNNLTEYNNSTIQ